LKTAGAIAADVTRSRTSDFVTLAKPRLNLLVVASALAGYVMGDGATAHPLLVIAMVAGTALVAGGASAFNQVIERQTDGLMRRTRLRPMADRRLQPREGIVFGIVLSIAGLSLLAFAVNVLSAGVAAATLISYAAIYTPLKLRTSFATVIGAIPGALPPVIGWAAATNSLSQGGGSCSGSSSSGSCRTFSPSHGCIARITRAPASPCSR
jgi:heme o synthase